MRVNGLLQLPRVHTPSGYLSAVLAHIDILAILGTLGNAVAPAAHLQQVLPALQCNLARSGNLKDAKFPKHTLKSCGLERAETPEKTALCKPGRKVKAGLCLYSQMLAGACKWGLLSDELLGPRLYLASISRDCNGQAAVRDIHDARSEDVNELHDLCPGGPWRRSYL